MRASPRMSSSGSEEVNSALLRISGTPPPRSRSRVFAAHTLAGQSVYLRAQGAHGWVASSHLVRDSCEYLATGAIAACMDNDPVWGRRAVGPEEIILCVVRAVASGAVRSARRRMCRPLAGITYGRFGSDHVSSSVKARAAGMDSTGGRLSRVGCLLVSWRRRSHDQLPACLHRIAAGQVVGQLAASPATVSGTPSCSPAGVSWPSWPTAQPTSFCASASIAYR